MRVYVAGPMSGIPQFNIPAFDEAATVLRSHGHDVVSPAEIDGPVTREVLLRSERGDHADLPQDETWGFYLSRDFRILADDGIEAVVTLEGWERSRGARLEVLMATELGLPRYDFDLEQGMTGPAERPTITMPSDELYDAAGNFISFTDNPLRQRSITGGVKDNRGKPAVDLMPMKPLLAVGRVLGFGARKYKPHNWRLGLSWSQTIGSALRHVMAFADGEDIDPESGECHIDNAICQLLFLSEYYHTGTGQDDRWSSIDAEQKEAARA